MNVCVCVRAHMSHTDIYSMCHSSGEKRRSQQTAGMFSPVSVKGDVWRAGQDGVTEFTFYTPGTDFLIVNVSLFCK